MRRWYLILFFAFAWRPAFAVPSINDVDVSPFEDRFIRELEANPLKIYFETRTIARRAKAEGKKTFSFERQRPTVERILKIINAMLAKNLTREQFPEREEFEALKREGEALLSDRNPYGMTMPYHGYISYGLKFLNLRTQVRRRENPTDAFIQSRYHEKLSASDLPLLLERWPDVILFLSFEAVGNNYFTETRVGRLHLIGATEQPEFGDGFLLPEIEWADHDIGHIAFMEKRDFELSQESDFDDVKSYEQFEANKKAIKDKIQTLHPANHPLADAAGLLLFEVTHERGYQYDLRQLKTQLETNKWTEVVHFKLQSNFWHNPPVAAGNYPLLEEGRKFLLKTIQAMIEEQAAGKISEFGRTSPGGQLEIIYQPPAQIFEGEIKGIEIDAVDRVQAFIEVSKLNRTVPLSVFEVSLAQRPAIEKSPLTADALAFMRMILWAKSNGVEHWRRGNGEELEGHVRSIRVLPNGILVRFEQSNLEDLGSTIDLKVTDLVPKEKIPDEIPNFDPIAIFKANQILKIQADAQPAKFSYIEPPSKMLGRVVNVRQLGTREGRVLDFKAHIEPPIVRSFPLNDVFVKGVQSVEPESKSSVEHELLVQKFGAWLSEIKYNDWKFYLGKMGDGLYMQPQFVAYDSYGDKVVGQHGRKWYLSSHMTKNEVIQTAYLAALTSAQHQARKNFLYKEQRIFGPHFSVDKRVDLAAAPSTDARRIYSQAEFEAIIREIKFPEGHFRYGSVLKDGQPGFYVQAIYTNPTPDIQHVTKPIHGEEFIMPAFATETGIVQKAVQAMISASQEEVKRNFFVRGQNIFANGSICVADLVHLSRDPAALDRRSPMGAK
jgi:hypothetical protein